MTMIGIADGADETNVWLTSFDGFDPDVWGFVGFADEARRARFLEGSRPGVLVLIWVTTRGPKDEQGKIVGVVQCSHETGVASDFMPRSAYEKKRADPQTRDKWDFAVRVVRAWRILPDQRQRIADFAPQTYFTPDGTSRAQFLGSQGAPLEPQEARKLFNLMVEEVDVFGGAPVSPHARGVFESLLRPSRPGPISQQGFWVEPAEGAKHLYVLQLTGKAATFLNDVSAFGKVIIKPGISSDPETRCEGLNSAYPSGSAFRWQIGCSTARRGVAALHDSMSAILAERAMQDAILAQGGRSLGNEFFLADRMIIDAVLDAGLTAAGRTVP
ncbi:hypothetical protein V5F77_15045 [Xanthobacter sp. DSM 24535]|uniref:hypothetical protein n=1 Tax=Roseixanthobacter psychrophilus TaxID=3119917 RepID=UPI003726963C